MILPHRCIAIVVISLFAAGCHKKAKPITPAAPVILPKAEATKPQPPPPLPPAPKIEGASGTIANPPVTNPPVTVEVKPPPPAQQPPSKKTRRTPPAKKGDVKAAEVRPPEVKIEPKPEASAAKPETTEAAPQPPATGLGEMLSPEQIRDYTRRLDAALERSRGTLLIIQSKTLNASQKQSAERIRGFITQAEQTRNADLANATSLAERADVLSKDLLDHIP